MSKQVLRLCRLQLINLFGMNELRYTKDQSKRAHAIGLGIVGLFVIAMAVLYVGAFSYGLAVIGMADIIPLYLYAVSSLLILIFSFFKAGSTLFSVKGFDLLVSLPVSRAAMIVSRFACMYVTNLMLGLLIMLPGLACYGYFVRPALGFYGIFLLGSLFLPLLPLTVSSILGAGITALSSRSRHRSIAETILMLALVVGVLGGSLFLSDKESQFTVEMMQNIAETLSVRIGHIYPPAIWFSDALSGDLRAGGLMLAIPLVIFTIFVVALQKYFLKICAAIHAVSAKNDYRMTSLQRSSHIVALWRRELRRYFASSVYVTNTLVGYIMALLLSVAICVMGLDRIIMLMGLPDVGEAIGNCLPLALSCLLCMTSTTSCSISMEGNTFWQLRTLPVSAKEIYDGKILLNLSVAAPFYVLSVIFLGVAIRPDVLQLMWLIVIPACYLLFSGVMGITVNLMFPVLEWENEVRVVKQSASMLVGMLIGILSGAIPLLGMVFMRNCTPEQIYLPTFVIMTALTLLLYKRNQKVEL